MKNQIRLRECGLFLLASLALCGVVFGDALLGRHLLAPVDIAPAVWSHYRFVDPGTNRIPANHHIVDQLGYDLPLQWTIYHAYRAGEIPWWDPYTYCGRPLLAVEIGRSVRAASAMERLCLSGGGADIEQEGDQDAGHQDQRLGRSQRPVP